MAAERSAPNRAADEPPVVVPPGGAGVPSASRLPDDRIVKSGATKSSGTAAAKEKDGAKKRR